MIIVSFNSLKPSAFVSQVERIVQELTANPHFPEPWPAGVPTLAQLQTDFSAYKDALTATTAGDRTRIFERNSARSRVANDLSLIGCNLQLTSQNDPDQLSTTGFPLQTRAARTTVKNLPDAPAQVQLLRGPLSGMVVVNASRVRSAGGYEAQIATGDPTVEANWTPAGSTKNCRGFEIQGLTPGKVYSVRLRAIGGAGTGPWAVSAGLMVV